MFGCDCFYWNFSEFSQLEIEPDPFILRAPLPCFPQGQGFASGRICLGEIEVIKITTFESVSSYKSPHGKTKMITFYKPTEVPKGFSCFGCYCHPSDQPLNGYVLVARDMSLSKTDNCSLKDPESYTLIWSRESKDDKPVYFWLPNAPMGYKALGFVISENPEMPSLDEVRCVREDLTETCEVYEMLLGTESKFSNYPFWVWKTRPCERGMLCRGVSVGTFFCTTQRVPSPNEKLYDIKCLKNFDSSLHAMPNLDRVHDLIKHYGPTIFFHPNEIFLPSSVSWFFKNGAVLCRYNEEEGERIDCKGSNLPVGGSNDGEFWIDLPKNDDKREYVKGGCLESAELYIHVKPALGGTFTDIVMWVFCPFNGPSTLKVGKLNIEMNKIGEHVCDWEHFTLRVSNFTGELWSVYFSQHSGGVWVDVSDLEYISGNKFIVYSSKGGHSSYPHPGSYIQGSSKIGIGVRNDAARSKFFVDSSTRYRIIAAEYLGDGVVDEPCWLDYMREWGPIVTYDVRSELEKLMKHLPVFVRFSVETLFDLFPMEIYGEEGPTGPKEKDNWTGDERW